MLPKASRLSRQEFNLVKQSGRRLFSSHFSLSYHADSQFKAAVVVSKKVSRSAVSRNRLRRRIYQQLKTGNWQLNTWIVIYPKLSMLNLTDDQLAFETNSLLSKIS